MTPRSQESGRLVISLDGADFVSDDTETPEAEQKPAGKPIKLTEPYLGFWSMDGSNEPIALFPESQSDIIADFATYLKQTDVLFVTSKVLLPKVKLVTRAFIRSVRDSVAD